VKPHGSSLFVVSKATKDDLATLWPMVEALHEHEHLPPAGAEVKQALQVLLAEPSRGRVLLGRLAGKPVGYCVLSFGFSLEFHGMDAFIDELYVQAPLRGEGFGRALLAEAEAVCRTMAIQAIHLEVERGNEDAKRLYEGRGYKAHERFLMTKWLE
jgi:ribosomal protein S18 acetylase RimI-like enzyme